MANIRGPEIKGFQGQTLIKDWNTIGQSAFGLGRLILGLRPFNLALFGNGDTGGHMQRKAEVS